MGQLPHLCSDLEGNYSEVSIISPPMILVESGLSSEQASLMIPIYFEIAFWY